MKPRRRARSALGSIEELSKRPANLPLSAYREVDWATTNMLVAEFGEASALRILNGKSYVVAISPADPATVAPPGAKAVPRVHQIKGERRMRETAG